MSLEICDDQAVPDVELFQLEQIGVALVPSAGGKIFGQPRQPWLQEV